MGDFHGYGEVEVVKQGACTLSIQEHLKAVTCEWRWTIPNFSKAAKSLIESEMDVLEQCRDSDHKGTTLSANLELDACKRNDIGLYFFIDLYSTIGGEEDDENPIKAHVKFSLGDGDDVFEKSDYAMEPSNYYNGNRAGWAKFVQRAQLLRYLKNDQLVIMASLTTYHSHAKDYQHQTRTLLLLHKELRRLGDFVIRCQGKDTKVLKALLAENSPVLAGMLESNWKEAMEGVLVIDEENDDLDHETIKSLVKYLYVGDLLEDMDAVQLLKVAEKYDIGRLKRLSVDRLKNELSLENACEMLVLGDLYRGDELKKAAMALISADPLAAQATEGWLQSLNSNVPLLNEVIATLGRQAEKNQSGGRKRKRQD